MSLPGALSPWFEQRCIKVSASGAIALNASGVIYFYEAGTSTPKDTYEDADLSTANPNPIILSDDGRPPDPIFFDVGGYKVVVCDDTQDPDDPPDPQSTLYTIDDVSNVAETHLAAIGNDWTSGAKDETTQPYNITANDTFVTTDTTTTVNLPAAADRTPTDGGSGQPLWIMNKGSATVTIVRNGGDSINNAFANITIPAGTTPDWPFVMLLSDGVSNWYTAARYDG